MFTVLLVTWASSAIVANAGPRPTYTDWKGDQQDKVDSEAADKAIDKKQAATDKALHMLQALKDQVTVEGEVEVAAYNKFACFCKDTTTDRLASIATGKDQQSSLTTSINTLSSKRDTLDTTIEAALSAIAGLEADMKSLEGQRRKTLKLYQSNTADLNAGLAGLRGAIQQLKASKTPSLMQLHSVSETVRTAALLADALGLGGKISNKAVTLLLQQPANDVQMEDYKYHSDGIIKVLEDLLVDFTKEQTEVNKNEVESIKVHDEAMQAKMHAKKTKNHELTKARTGRSQTIDDIARDSQQLSTVEATLREDELYTAKLQKLCSDKAKTWDQRSAARLGELSTLTEAIGMIADLRANNVTANTIRFMQRNANVRVAKRVAVDSDAMEAIEAAAEQADTSSDSAVPAFLQLAPVQRGMLRATVKREEGSRSVVVDLLKSQGRELKSTLLTALAAKIAEDPFAKVKQLIQELIERLLQEASNEANQKGWCDKATSDATEKRDYAVEEIADLNSQIEKLESERNRLTDELTTLREDINELVDVQLKTEKERTEEQHQNDVTTQEAKDGLAGINLCIDLLDKFYKTLKKESVNLALVQGPEDDMPDTGFKIGEAYTGSQSKSVGILAMLDVMKSDFLRTITETDQSERQAQRDFLEFMTQTNSSLQEKYEAQMAKKDQKNDVVQKYDDAWDLLNAESDKLQGALRELRDLKPVCITTGMAYNDRVAHREEEIESLNKALCILGKYEQYGPDGTGGC